MTTFKVDPSTASPLHSAHLLQHRFKGSTSIRGRSHRDVKNITGKHEFSNLLPLDFESVTTPNICSSVGVRG